MVAEGAQIALGKAPRIVEEEAAAAPLGAEVLNIIAVASPPTRRQGILRPASAMICD